MTIKNEIVEVGGRRWLIREATSMEAAQQAIASSRCSGAVGTTTVVDSTRVGGERVTTASVVQVNSDGTERQPYTEPY